MIVWQPVLPPVVLALVILAVGVGLVALARVQRRRHGATWWHLWLPKAAAALLLVLAALGPARLDEDDGGHRRLLVLVDQSASMARADAPGGTRFQRAMTAAGRIQAVATAAGAQVEVRGLDETLRAAPTAPRPGLVPGTDLVASLRAATPEDAVGIVLLSDGGEEPLAGADGLPAAPIATVAVGGDPEALASVGIVALAAPDSAEPGAVVEVAADLVARGGAAFRARCGSIPVALEQRDAEGIWKPLNQAMANLDHGRAHVDLRFTAGTPGALALRVAVRPPAGDSDPGDDARPFQVTVRERRLRVLYLTRNPGIEVKHLRDALGRDPGIAFAAVYRTLGERWGVQADDPAVASELAGGLPADLSRWEVVILGAFPAADLAPADAQRLAAWVQAGGGLALLGGDQALGCGGWFASPLAPAAPWALTAAEPPPERGTIPVAATTTTHEVATGLAEALGSSAVASLNRAGALRPGATALVTARLGGAEAALVAVQTWGAGRVLGVASDSWWRLPRSATGLLWRQGARWLAGQAEGTGALRARWDHGRYRPGEVAQVVARVTGGGASPALTATLTAPDGTNRPLAGAAAGDGSWTIAVPFAGRGTWTIDLRATASGAEVGRYHRTVEVQPLLPEGARAARDDAGLAALARAHGGVAVGEENLTFLRPWLEERCRPAGVRHARSLLDGWWLAALLICLGTEWILRRRRGLV